MTNSMASITIKPTAAFNRGDTFTSGSWVCTADGAGSFQRYLTMTSDPETGLVTLPEAAMGQLVEKFDEISLYNNVANVEFGSRPTLTRQLLGWSHASWHLSHRVEYYSPMSNSHTASAVLAQLTRMRSSPVEPARSEVASEYSSDSSVLLDYNSNSSYEFYFRFDPIELEADCNSGSYAEKPLSGHAIGLVIKSTPAGRFIY
jgi:hypothetical protein